MAKGNINNPSSWVNGTIVQPSWCQDVQDTCNSVFTGDTSHKALQIDGTGLATVSLPDGYLGVSGDGVIGGTLSVGGTSTFSSNLSATGNLSIGGTSTFTGNIIASGTLFIPDIIASTKVLTPHIYTTSTITSGAVTLGTGAGTGASVAAFDGTDVAGMLSITTAGSPAANQLIARITFGMPYASKPKAVMLTPANVDATNVGWYSNHGMLSTTKFEIWARNPGLTSAITYSWYYFVVG